MQKLIHWSEQNFHHLPWRKNRSLYNTIVSEFMLQQTTVSTVIPRFLSFIQKFPVDPVLEFEYFFYVPTRTNHQIYTLLCNLDLKYLCKYISKTM